MSTAEPPRDADLEIKVPLLDNGGNGERVGIYKYEGFIGLHVLGDKDTAFVLVPPEAARAIGQALLNVGTAQQ